MTQVLIIDSDADVAAALSEALQGRGVQTKVIADGAEGLKAARDDGPDAIVLCVELNRVSGYSICNKLKKSPDLAKIPLILTSDKATEETFEQHKKLKTRAEQYIKKPYELDQMLGLIAQYIDVPGDGPRRGDSEEVPLDDMDVDIGADASAGGRAVGVGAKVGGAAGRDVTDGLGAAFGGGGFEGLDTGATTVMKVPAGLAAAVAAEQARNEAPRTPKPARAETPAPSDAQTERLRTEVKTLRSKVTELEDTLQRKEEEFTDRLLQESSRSREGIELKKKLGQVEREIARYKTAAEKAEQKAADLESQLQAVQQQGSESGKEKDALSEKLGQLVDKLKAVATERDELRLQLDGLKSKAADAEEEVAQAQQVRAKAKKAVDIAVQLLEDTGLLQ